MTASGRIGVVGGTFDPIHVGHTTAAIAAAERLGLAEVLLVPSHIPPHRHAGPRASAYHRFAMVTMAAQTDPRLRASDIELVQAGPSFTAVTLRRLAESGLAPWQLFFILGTDAFAEIATWHDYPAVLDLANFAVMTRPGTPLEELPARLPALAPRMTACQPIDQDEAPPRIHLIRAETPAVSSTVVRSRLAAGESIDGLVDPAVAQHIRRHRLYASS